MNIIVLGAGSWGTALACLLCQNGHDVTLQSWMPQQIEEIMNADIHEDAWARQKAEKVRYKGKKLAKNIETALFMCPNCRRIGTVHGEKNDVVCSCGMKPRSVNTVPLIRRLPLKTWRSGTNGSMISF